MRNPLYRWEVTTEVNTKILPGAADMTFEPKPFIFRRSAQRHGLYMTSLTQDLFIYGVRRRGEKEPDALT